MRFSLVVLLIQVSMSVHSVALAQSSQTPKVTPFIDCPLGQTEVLKFTEKQWRSGLIPSWYNEKVPKHQRSRGTYCDILEGPILMRIDPSQEFVLDRTDDSPTGRSDGRHGEIVPGKELIRMNHVYVDPSDPKKKIELMCLKPEEGFKGLTIDALQEAFEKMGIELACSSSKASNPQQIAQTRCELEFSEYAEQTAEFRQKIRLACRDGIQRAAKADGEQSIATTKKYCDRIEGHRSAQACLIGVEKYVALTNSSAESVMFAANKSEQETKAGKGKSMKQNLPFGTPQQQKAKSGKMIR